MTKTYRANIENVYKQILDYNTQDSTIITLQDVNKDNKIDNKDLRELFNKYMDGDNKECSQLGNFISGTDVSNYVKNTVCSEHPKNVIVGYYLDTSCRTQVKTKELKNDSPIKSIENACGYIIYGLKGSKGSLGDEVFTVAIGKIGLRD